MNANELVNQQSERIPNPSVPANRPNIDPEPDFRLNRWLVYFASGTDWSSVGEFVATDATSAIERAVEVFGEASAYRAELIPWDCAPLLKPTQWPARDVRR